MNASALRVSSNDDFGTSPMVWKRNRAEPEGTRIALYSPHVSDTGHDGLESLKNAHTVQKCTDRR